jgi:tellurite resistance protein
VVKLLRARAVRAINRHRAPEERIKFRSKNTIVRQMLNRIAPRLPPDCAVIIQFDSWYASKKLLKFVHRRKRQFTWRYEAVDKYVVAVHLAWAYIERRFVIERGAQIKCCGDLIRRHREEHAESVLTAAVEMTLQGATREEVLQQRIYVKKKIAVSLATHRVKESIN